MTGRTLGKKDAPARGQGGMGTLRALLWDVDGTIAETERDGHRVAFNLAFEALSLPWRWDVERYGELLQVAGGRERLLHFMRGRADAPADAAARETLARELHRRKNAFYAERVACGGIAARPGVLRLVDACEQHGVRQAVATTTSTGNVEALFSSLWGARWRERFPVVVCAEDAPAKKPDPLVYRIALDRLGVAAEDAFAIEDSPNGLAAARAAGLRCGVAPSAYFARARFAGVAWQVLDLAGVTLPSDGGDPMPAAQGAVGPAAASR